MTKHTLKPVDQNIKFDEKLREKDLTREQVIEMERSLAKFANSMDSLVRIPFTKQGVGADAALSTFPVAGDIAGLILTGYAFLLAIKMGVPLRKLLPAVKLAVVDSFVGLAPGAGTVMDIFIRPSRKTVHIVRQHLQDEYGIKETQHIEHPFMHQALQEKQQHSEFWRKPLVAWIYLHIPDLLGLLFLIMMGAMLWTIGSWMIGFYSQHHTIS